MNVRRMGLQESGFSLTDGVVEKYGAKYLRTADCLTKDWEARLGF